MQKPGVCGTLKKMRNSSLCLQVEFEERIDEREGWRAGLPSFMDSNALLRNLGILFFVNSGTHWKVWRCGRLCHSERSLVSWWRMHGVGGQSRMDSWEQVELTMVIKAWNDETTELRVLEKEMPWRGQILSIVWIWKVKKWRHQRGCPRFWFGSKM